jgi:Reverse transcriptase (RNA-dependent DNA polymerase)
MLYEARYERWISSPTNKRRGREINIVYHRVRLFEWVVACFGLKNSPVEFARYMNDILREYMNDFVVVYFDDIIIFSTELDTHWKHVREVLGKLRERKVNLKIKKCEFTVRETEYLGHIINGETMQEDKRS